MEGIVAFSGEVAIKKIGGTVKAPLSWRIRNMLRWNYIKAWIGVMFISPIANKFGLLTGWGELRLVLIKADGRRIDYGVVSRQLVTDAGVAYIVDDWDGGANVIDNFNYHGFGTDDTPGEAVGDTALQLECTTALNPDSTRATGTKSQPTANAMRTVGTLTFDASAAVVEHGVFTQAATGGGTLLDRSTFSAVNVVSGDSIQATYTLTLSSGG
jgi:hypothetical protein